MPVQLRLKVPPDGRQVDALLNFEGKLARRDAIEAAADDDEPIDTPEPAADLLGLLAQVENLREVRFGGAAVECPTGDGGSDGSARHDRRQVANRVAPRAIDERRDEAPVRE